MSHSSIPLLCKCGKTYKMKQPFIKHVQKCQFNIPDGPSEEASTENTNVSEEVPAENTNTHEESRSENTNKPSIKPVRHCVPTAETLSQLNNEVKNDLQTFMSGGRPLPTHEPLEGENILVNTLVIETLFKTVLSQVLIHHHRHTQSIIEQNAKLIEENKMLINLVGNVVCNKNNIRSETVMSDENESTNSSDTDTV